MNTETLVLNSMLPWQSIINRYLWSNAFKTSTGTCTTWSIVMIFERGCMPTQKNVCSMVVRKKRLIWLSNPGSIELLLEFMVCINYPTTAQQPETVSSHLLWLGVSYGVGVYFSAQALYSNRYAVANTKGEKRMFLVRVLIGRTTLGNPSMKVPPAGHDSTTDGKHIYVTYHDAQAYSEYLITYR